LLQVCQIQPTSLAKVGILFYTALLGQRQSVRTAILFQAIKDFFVNRKQRKLEKNSALVKNAKAIREERYAAIEFLCGLDSPEQAIPGLLHRFDFSLEHGINDTKEKEMSMDGILKHGSAALPFVTEHLKKSDRIAWPLKILYKIGTEDQIVATLQNALNFSDVSFDRSAVDKNYDIICYLREHQLGSYIDKLGHFLQDHDERVRFATVEALIEQKDASIPARLEGFLADDSAENRRIRKSVLDAFLTHGWTLKNPQVFPNGQVIDGISINASNKLERAGR